MVHRIREIVVLVSCSVMLTLTLACGSASHQMQGSSTLTENKKPDELLFAQSREQLKDKATAFIFVGDNGQGDANQEINAKAMRHFCDEHACQFISYMGDNFNSGVKDVDDPRFKSRFEDIYSGFTMPFRVVLGNHDYLGSIEAEIDYTARSNLWYLPSRYYAYHTEQAEFFVIDSNNFDNEQGAWLESALKNSPYPWKIVIGHHPVYSSGMHKYNEKLAVRLLPILRSGKANFYFSGHDHDKELIKKKDMYFVVCGTGSNPRDLIIKQKNRNLFSSGKLGFCYMQITATEVNLRMIDSQENVEFGTQFDKVK